MRALGLCAVLLCAAPLSGALAQQEETPPPVTAADTPPPPDSDSVFTGSNFDIDPTTPIEVRADTLELRGEEKIGVFQGDVEVIQGRIRLQAQTIEVHYAQGEDASASNQTVKRLDAKGDVRISTPDDQALSQYAVYDVVNQVVVLGGGVRLTRGPNILKGSRLTIDLGRNVTRLEPSADDVENGIRRSAKGRVSGVFVPPPRREEPEAERNSEKKKKKQKDDGSSQTP